MHRTIAVCVSAVLVLAASTAVQAKPGHGNGVGNPHVPVTTPVTPGPGSARSDAQQIVNTLHPTGKTRANAEHLLNSTKRLSKHHGKGPKWK